MNSRQQELRHLAYFEHLAGLEETDAEWRAGTAGLVVLRLLDAWLEEGPELVRAGSWSFEAARAEVEAISSGDSVRTILAGVLEGMTDSPRPTMTPIAPRLMAYGHALNLKAQWHLATDVYRTILELANPAEDLDVLIDANMRLGYCLRIQGDHTNAQIAYSTAGVLAESVGDIVKVLRARIAHAKIAIDRGNLPHAEEILDSAIEETRKEARLSQVHAVALQDRAAVAHLRGDYERAIHLGYQAMSKMSDPAPRDRVLKDIAASFLELGVRSAARDAHLILAATAQEQYVRWAATLNLLEIAALDSCEPVFEQYRRELADVSLPPTLEAAYYLYVGRGHHIFGHTSLAKAALLRAIDIASRNRLNQLSFEAEEELRNVDRGRAADPRPDLAPNESVRPVAVAIRSMRTLARLGA